MAVRPLRPANDHRLGRPLPHQLTNRTQATHIAKGPKVPIFNPEISCGISLSFPKLSHSIRHIPTRYSPVRHSSSVHKCTPLPFDLHVLSVPPAFNLSQDQTLQLNCLSSFQNSISSLYPSISHSSTSAHTNCLVSFIKELKNDHGIISGRLVNSFFDFVKNMLIVRLLPEVSY